jgi:Fic-DOC domain mobile mystery protein B
MSKAITAQPEDATPLDDISGLLRDDITNRKQLDEAETLNILSAQDWIARGRLGDLFTIPFYQKLHTSMFNQVWAWAGQLRSITGDRPNIGVDPATVPMELGAVAMEYNRQWEERKETESLLPLIANYHHALVKVHPFNNGNGRWSRLACDAVMIRLAKVPPITWATDTLTIDSDERKRYISALKQADQFNQKPLIEYLSELNPDH